MTSWVALTDGTLIPSYGASAMPMKSQAQNAAMHSAAQGESTIGIPKKVGKEFVAASHGQDVKALPKRKTSPFRLPGKHG